MPLPKQYIPILLHQKRHQHTAYTCGEDLADADGEAEEPPCIGDTVGILQDKGDDEDIGENGGHGEKKSHAAQCEFAERVSTQRAEQGGDRTEEDVIDDTAGQKICQHTADRETGDGTPTHEKGQDAKCLRKAALDGTGG